MVGLGASRHLCGSALALRPQPSSVGRPAHCPLSGPQGPGPRPHSPRSLASRALQLQTTVQAPSAVSRHPHSGGLVERISKKSTAAVLPPGLPVPPALRSPTGCRLPSLPPRGFVLAVPSAWDAVPANVHEAVPPAQALPPQRSLPTITSHPILWRPLPSRAPRRPSRTGWRPPGEPLGACPCCAVCGPGLPHSPIPPLRDADCARGLLRSPFLEATERRGRGQDARLGPGARDASPPTVYVSPPTVCVAHSLNLPSLSFPSGWNILRDHLQQRLRAGSGVRPPEPEPSPLFPGSVDFSALTVVVAIKSQCPLACRTAPVTVPTGQLDDISLKCQPPGVIIPPPFLWTSALSPSSGHWAGLAILSFCRKLPGLRYQLPPALPPLEAKITLQPGSPSVWCSRPWTRPLHCSGLCPRPPHPAAPADLASSCRCFDLGPRELLPGRAPQGFPELLGSREASPTTCPPRRAQLRLGRGANNTSTFNSLSKIKCHFTCPQQL